MSIVLVGCGSDAPPSGERSPTGPDTGTAEIDSDELARIVLQPDESLPGTAYEPGASGPLSLEELAAGMQSDPASFEASGFIAAYQSAFPDRQANPTNPPPPSDVSGVVSVAVLFEDTAAASAFLKSRFPEDQPIPGAEYSEPDVGEESLAVVTEITTQRPRIASIIWRRANLYLFLNVFGDFAVEQSLELARTIDARAISAAK